MIPCDTISQPIQHDLLVIAFSSRNEVDALQAYKAKCATLEAETDEFHCNSSKLSQYEQVHAESK